MSCTRTVLSPHDVVKAGLCIGCGACTAAAGVDMTMDEHGQLKPAGPVSRLRTPSEAIPAICPFSPVSKNEDEIGALHFPDAPLEDDRLGWYEATYVGAAKAGFEHGSSGGMVSWVAAELLRAGPVDGVAHVRPGAGGAFAYRISRSAAELAGARSRYYPVELSDVLEAIRNTPGRYAVVGVPCFIKALHLLRARDRCFASGSWLRSGCSAAT